MAHPRQQGKTVVVHEVRKDVKAAYEEYLQHNPNDDLMRSSYAGYCCMTQLNDDARKQFKLLGNDLEATPRFSIDWLRKQRERLSN